MTGCRLETLADAHVILGRRDGMIDLRDTRDFLDAARREGHAVTHYDIDSTHLLELDAPEAAAAIIRRVIYTME
jgi:hypothetical protein